MQLLKNYLQPLNLLDQEGLPKVLKEIAARLNYTTPKLENGKIKNKLKNKNNMNYIIKTNGNNQFLLHLCKIKNLNKKNKNDYELNDYEFI